MVNKNNSLLFSIDELAMLLYILQLHLNLSFHGYPMSALSSKVIYPLGIFIKSRIINV